jgi:hypothetical protein
MKISAGLALIGLSLTAIHSPMAQGAPIRRLSGESTLAPLPPDDDPAMSEKEVPANNLCEDAEMVKVGAMVMATTEGATSELLLNPCGAFTADPGTLGAGNTTGIWYGIQGTGGGLDVNVNATYSMQVAVFHGACDILTCVDGAAGYSPVAEVADVKWRAYEGEVYYILVTGSDNAVGEFTMEVMEGQVPENDDCEAAPMIEVGQVVNGTTEFAGAPGPSVYPFCSM